MKRVLSVIAILSMVFCLVGCGQNKNRKLYNVNLNKYVKLGEYKGIIIDTSTDEFQATQDSLIANDISNNDLYVKKTDGKVINGDTVNIDYVGKKNGKAFDGGTAEGYDLEIGSGSFIDGFEDGLIGKKIGSTVDLNLKFPEDYGNDELNGADVVFTVTVNYVKTDVALDPEDYYEKLGYKSLEDYNENVKQRAIEDTFTNKIIESSEINDYPNDDLNVLTDYYYDVYKNNIEYNYNVDFSDYLTYNNQTEDDFKDYLVTNTVKPYMDMQMLWYAIFDNEKMTFSDEDITNKIKEIIVQSGDTSTTESDVREYLGDEYIESLVISEKVFDFIEKNAVIS